MLKSITLDNLTRGNNVTNWCYNIVEVKPKDPNDLERIKEFIGTPNKDNADYFDVDFTILKPMPDELNGLYSFDQYKKLSDYTIERYDFNRIGLNSEVRFVQLAKLHDYIDYDTVDDIDAYFSSSAYDEYKGYRVEDILEYLVRQHDDVSEIRQELVDIFNIIEADNRAHCQREYGYKDWYSWCISEWGTKWNAGKATIVETGKPLTATITFSTAWSEPSQWFLTLCEKIESLNIKTEIFMSYGEDDGYFGGQYSMLLLPNDQGYHVEHRDYLNEELEEFLVEPRNNPYIFSDLK